MQRKREVMDAREAWLHAQRELDAAIGIELEGETSAEVPAVNIRRFRAAVLAERSARLRYAKALEAARKVVPEDLLWDVGEAGQSEAADSE